LRTVYPSRCMRRDWEPESEIQKSCRQRINVRTIFSI